MISLTLALPDRGYRIYVGQNLAAALPDLLKALRGRPLVTVAGRRVYGLHRRRLAGVLQELGAGTPLLVNDGEQWKTPALVATMHDGFLARGLRRDGVVLAIGGGVVGDTAGFAAATYMRGVRWVVMPSTLLSMVDSAIGGKVGVNHPKAKNLIGAFHQPQAVVSDTTFLDTLPPRELRSGAYEVIKCGILGDAALFRSMQRAPVGLGGWDPGEREGAIAAASRLKAEVVAQDEQEGGLRRVLNLGHTLGHALESVTRYRRFTHGEAVGSGLIAAAWIAHRRGLLAGFEEVAEAVERIGPRPPVSDLQTAAVLDAISRDKKAKAGKVPFILPTAIGKVVIHDDVGAAEVKDALRVLGRREKAGWRGSRAVRSVR